MPEFHRRMGNRLRSPEEGADTIIWLCVSNSIKDQPSGGFFQGYIEWSFSTLGMHVQWGLLNLSVCILDAIFLPICVTIKWHTRVQLPPLSLPLSLSLSLLYFRQSGCVRAPPTGLDEILTRRRNPANGETERNCREIFRQFVHRRRALASITRKLNLAQNFLYTAQKFWHYHMKWWESCTEYCWYYCVVFVQLPQFWFAPKCIRNICTINFCCKYQHIIINNGCTELYNTKLRY